MSEEWNQTNGKMTEDMLDQIENILEKVGVQTFFHETLNDHSITKISKF